MEWYKTSNRIPAWPIVTALVVLVTAVMLLGDTTAQTPQLVLADGVLILAAQISVMAEALRRSMRRTLYSYTNIGLVGGIVFALVFAGVLTADFFSCLRMEEISMQTVFRSVLDFPRRFSYWAAFVILAVSALLAVSNVALIRHEGFCLTNALSLLVAGVYVGGTALVYWLSDLSERFFQNAHPAVVLSNSMISLFLLLMLCYFECVLVGSAVMGWVAARTVPAFDKDYIIILGCSIDKRGGLLPLLKGRVNRAIRFAWEQEIATGKSAKFVPSGGQGPNEVISEGSAMELYLLSHGAEDYEVLPEKKSANTWENLCFSKKITDEYTPDAKVAFATTNYHILRSGILARRAGLDAEGVAGDTKWYFWPNGFVREFFGILTLEIRAHVIAAVCAAALCAALGLLGWFGGLVV